MPRIRTIKPEFFLHEGLYDLEQGIGLPVRLAFAGLWCHADRAGRFRWRPRTLKAGILPHDDLDFSRVLDALATRGFVVKYASNGYDFGWIPGFARHQVINNKERESELPNPETSHTVPRVDDAFATREAREPEVEKGKGKERKGKERKGKERKGIQTQTACVREANPPALPNPQPTKSAVKPFESPPPKQFDPPLEIPAAPEPLCVSQENPLWLWFLRLKAFYPRGHWKNGAAEQRAWGLFRVYAPTEKDAEAVVTGASRWAQSDRWKRGFVETPETFLRDSQWQREPPPPQKRTQTAAEAEIERNTEAKQREREKELNERAYQEALKKLRREESAKC